MHKAELFLKEFTKELIFNSRTGQRIISRLKNESWERAKPVLKPVIIQRQIPVKDYKTALAKKPEQVPESSNQPSLNKIDMLLKDPRVTVIECPGPGKFVLARTSGRTALTRITLSQDEIQGLIKNFSEEAKIPIISGLFKAAVNNLVITAVISELVGSRFIITKITPQSILEQSV